MRKVAILCLAAMVIAFWAQVVVAAEGCGTCDSYAVFSGERNTEITSRRALSNALRKAKSDGHHIELVGRLQGQGYNIMVDYSKLYDLGEGYYALMLPVKSQSGMGILYNVSHPDGSSSAFVNTLESSKLTTVWGSDGVLKTKEVTLALGDVTVTGYTCAIACGALTSLGCYYACLSMTASPKLCAVLCGAGAGAMCQFICSMQVGEPGAPTCGLPGFPDCCGLYPWPDCE